MDDEDNGTGEEEKKVGEKWDEDEEGCWVFGATRIGAGKKGVSILWCGR
jgi:hypothetical protein